MYFCDAELLSESFKLPKGSPSTISGAKYRRGDALEFQGDAERLLEISTDPVYGGHSGGQGHPRYSRGRPYIEPVLRRQVHGAVESNRTLDLRTTLREDIGKT